MQVMTATDGDKKITRNDLGYVKMQHNVDLEQPGHDFRPFAHLKTRERASTVHRSRKERMLELDKPGVVELKPIVVDPAPKFEFSFGQE